MPRENTSDASGVSRPTIATAAGARMEAREMSGTGAARGGQGRRRGPRETPHITAHRGFRDVFPQNTIAAIKGSTRLGADRIEIDVAATSDGELVVFHDETLDPLTDAAGAVGETPSETVLQAEVLDSGETIPTLADALDAANPDVMMNIEFKESGPLSWTEFAERTLQIASRFPGEYNVSSFDPDALRAVREADPRVPVALLFGENKRENLAIAHELGAEAINPSTGVLDRDLVETAHEDGREVNVWTIDNWREARDPVRLGVDGLIADYPHMTTSLTMVGRGEERRVTESL